MSTRPATAIDEWYHCFNRGTDKRQIFMDREDYERFLSLLYVCNSKQKKRLSDFSSHRDLHGVLVQSKGEPLVDIVAYALMPNHIHLIIKQCSERGMATFMQRLFTAYTKYFNSKQGRAGTLVESAYKSKHLYDDRYLKHAVAYVLLNPAGLMQPEKSKGRGFLFTLQSTLQACSYSSLPDFLGESRIEGKILGNVLNEMFDTSPSFNWLREHYKDDILN